MPRIWTYTYGKLFPVSTACVMTPDAANMARRQCVISFSFMSAVFSGVEQKFSGSRPKSPGMRPEPTERLGGSETKRGEGRARARVSERTRVWFPRPRSLCLSPPPGGGARLTPAHLRERDGAEDLDEA